jgi:molecular chaperone HtpG
MNESVTTNGPDGGQHHGFRAEVSQVLDLVIHSLYSHKEIFLRELLSNASDALDRLRFRAIEEPDLLEGDPALEIRVTPEPAAGILRLEDNGIGMTESELIENLGTVARSGTRAFVQQLSENARKDTALIGQFGVGFYSAYLVADRVEVISRAAGQASAFRWTSDAKNGFDVAPAERARRGTEIILHLKEEHREFAEAWRLEELISRYSDFVSHPILLKKGGDKDGAAGEYEKVNQASALWQRPRAELSKEQYDDFYKHLTHDVDAPLAHTHFRMEGTQSFVALLYVPKRAPFDLQMPSGARGVRLFVKRVFVMDKCEELVPSWLRFVRGVIDSDDLPLNVSRELLQESSAVRAIRKQVVRKTLDLLDELAAERVEDYAAFFRTFGPVVKEGLATDHEYKDRLGKLVRYESSHGDGLTSLAEYVARMPADQKEIYYLLGESRRALVGSPYLEALRSHGYEVLYMTDPVDEWAAEALGTFDGKKLASAMRADLKLEAKDDAKTDAAPDAALQPLFERMERVLSAHVGKVRISNRLTESPCCLVRDGGSPSAYVERLLRERGHATPQAKRTLEVNAHHPLVENLARLEAASPGSPELVAWIETLYDQALLSEGAEIEDPNRFAKRVADLLSRAAAAAAGVSPPK